MQTYMAKKDPAALFFIEKWLTATAEMKADCRGWYLNLILHQFDKKDLPNDVEELASLAQVRVSEYEQFKQVFEQVLKHKFEQNSRGRLENPIAREILQSREDFKEKRSDAGKMSYFITFIRKHLCSDENVISFVKKHVDLTEIDVKNQTSVQNVFKQTVELYININKLDPNLIGKLMLKEGIVDSNYRKEQSENSFNQFPKRESFNGLPEHTIGMSVQYISITKRVDVSEDDVNGLWEIFKSKHLTGKKFYQDEGSVYSHFLESLKYQNFSNGTHKQTSGGSIQTGGSRSKDRSDTIAATGLANRKGNNAG